MKTFCIISISLLLSITACNNTKALTKNSYPLSDTATVTIQAINLTEDMSSFSSKEDEVIMLLYQFDSVLNKPYLAKEHTFKKRGESYTFLLPRLRIQHTLFVLLERDTENSTETVENQFRKNHVDINNALLNSDYTQLEKLLGDDDVIGIKHITNTPTVFYFSGVYKLDRFEYHVFID